MPKRQNRQPTPKWSMYPTLHDEVSSHLQETNLHYTFHPTDSETHINFKNTNIMGYFTCPNTNCRKKGWQSKKIATRIRLYTGNRYNARVYHQRCKSCNGLSRPELDHSYAERVAYRLKKWGGIPVEVPVGTGQSKGPHDRRLCEGCKVGHCAESIDFVAGLER